MKSITSRGISLLEALVYIAIVTVALLAIVFIIVQTAQTYGRNRADRLVSLAAETAVDRIAREIRQACDIVSVSGSSLTLQTFLTLEGGASCQTATLTNRVISFSGNQVTIDGTTLISGAVKVTSLQFTEITGDGATQKAVRVTLQISDAGDRVRRTYYFTTTLRGSY